MDSANASGEIETNKVCLNSFKKHWAEAQIDGPMQTIARYDDVAKLLITIGGFLLAVLANGYSAMLRDRATIDTTRIKATSYWVFGLMLLFFVAAALVCYFQPRMRAFEIMKRRDDEDLTQEITAWCVDLRRVLTVKRLLLYLAMISFIGSFVLLMSLLLSLF
jgi:hypothetical protein